MERLSDNNPCNTCKVDRQIGNPYSWQCECDRCLKPSRWKDECVKKLKEYEYLEEQGKLLKPPCAVGDTVYRIDDGEIYEQVVRGILFRENKILAQDGNGSILGELCKDVFLTKSAAEQELRQLENKGSD